MKKIFFAIAIFFIFNLSVFASTYVEEHSVSYSPWNWTTSLNDFSNSSHDSINDCWTRTWVDDWAWSRDLMWYPTTSWLASSSWNMTCRYSYYYSFRDYTRTFTARNWITNCDSWDRVISISPSTCTSWTCTITCRKYDNVSPILSNITNIPDIDLLADNNYNYILSLDNWWHAPITRIEWVREDKDSWNISDNFTITTNCTTPTWSSTSICTQSWDISKVDDFIESNWWREYTFRIKKICDRAWNCWNWIEDKNHFVYANTNWPLDGIVSNHYLDWAIADWQPNSLIVKIEDEYWNPLIPASWIDRKINYNFDINHNLVLNQYTRSWDTSVFINRTGSNWESSIFHWNNNFLDETSNNWEYDFWFKFYTPTSNSYEFWNWPVSDPDAKFIINNITFDINSDLWDSTSLSIDNSDITAKINPLYYSEITWTWITLNWFVEWARQDSKISIKRNWTINYGSNLKLQLSYSWSDSSKFNMYAGTNISNAMSWWTLINSRADIDSNLTFTSNNNNLYTYLLQKPWAVWYLSNIFLATHITYTIDWKTVVYNSDIVWKDSYHWTEGESNTSQSSLKVLWQISSKSNNSITQDQFPSDVRIVWNSDKFTSKTQIRKNWWEFAKNVIWSTETTNALIDIDSPNSTLFKEVNNVIYFWSEIWAWWNVYKLWNWSDDIWINTKKTILVIWWDLYIRNNLYYSSNNSMLGIVVLKDQYWNWWNIYVDPSVTNIVWTLFAEKSILWYDWTEIDWSTDVVTLKNQLHIYGSLFSENTIGWSREETPRCPYYITSGCDYQTAQKYDLNYLRRYYLINSEESWITYKKPANNWKAIWWWTYVSAWNLTWWNPDFARNITNTSQDYAWNSVLIEYNSSIQWNPPPLFSK